MQRNSMISTGIRGLILALSALLSAVASAQEPSPAPPQPAPAPHETPVEGAPSLDRLLEDLAKIDPAVLAERLTAMQAQIAKLKEETETLKVRIAANEAEMQKLALHVLLLDALLKVRGTLPAPQPQAATPPATPPAVVMTGNTDAPPPLAAAEAASAPPAPPPPDGANDAPAPSPTPEVQASPPEPSAVAPPPNYQDHVYPIFAESCLGCHNPDKAKGGLVLDSFPAMMQGGGSGMVIVPRSPDQSRLYRLVAHLDTPTMPPMRGKLPDDRIDVLRRWIAAGAPPDAAAAQNATVVSETTPNIVAPPTIFVDHETGPMPGPSLADVGPRPVAQAPPVTALAVSPAAPLLAVAGFEQILLFHLDDGRWLGAIDLPGTRVESLTFSDDGTALLAAAGVAGKQGSALLFEIESGRRIAEFDRQYDTALCADISPGGTLVAVGGANRKVRVFDGFTADRLFEITDHTDWVQAVAFSPDGLYLASADRADGLYLWESDTGRRVHELRGHTGGICALAFQPDSAVLASVGRDGTMRLWNVEDGNLVRQVSAHAVAALDVAAAPNGRWATCGADGCARIWNPDGSEFRTLEPRRDWVYQAVFSADGAKLVTGDWTGAMLIYETDTGALQYTISTSAPVPSRPVAAALQDRKNPLPIRKAGGG